MPDFNETLRPTYVAVDSMGDGRPLMLVQAVARGTALDETSDDDSRTGWFASPQAKLERFLREVKVPAGLLCNGDALRLVYAPSGESSGHLTFPLAAMCEVSGRPILAALDMLLSEHRVFSAPDGRRLGDILSESRRYQAEVSNALSDQVLGALWELLLQRVRRAEFSDLPAVVRDCDRALEQPVGGRWAPGPPVSGVVARCVADVAADRILASIGGGDPRMDFGESPTPRAGAVLARLEASRERPDAVLGRVAAGHLVGGDRDDARVLDVVVGRADAIVDFILDPTRAWRSDRVRDVEHSRAANPWAELQAEREWKAGAPDPGRDRHRGADRAAVVEPGC